MPSPGDSIRSQLILSLLFLPVMNPSLFYLFFGQTTCMLGFPQPLPWVQLTCSNGSQHSGKHFCLQVCYGGWCKGIAGEMHRPRHGRKSTELSCPSSSVPFSKNFQHAVIQKLPNLVLWVFYIKFIT